MTSLKTKPQLSENMNSRIAHLPLIAATLCLGSLTTVGQSAKRSEIDLSLKLEETAKAKGWDDGGFIIDNRSTVERWPELEELKTLVRRDWRSVATNIMHSNPSQTQRAVLLLSAQALTLDQYREFIDFALGEAEASRLERREMVWAISPQQSNLQRVWIDTYAEDQTIKSVERLKKLYPEDTAIGSFCQKLLSGEATNALNAHLKETGALSDSARPHHSSQPESRVPKPATAPNQAPESKSAPTSAASNEPQDSTPWAIVVVVAAAIGLLWLMLKRRAK